MRQIIAAVIRKLSLTIFAPVTVGLLITASASAEPKGSFELPSNPTITMANSSGNCSGRNGDIGVDSNGLILSCQGSLWKVNGNKIAYSGSFSRKSTSAKTYSIGEFPVCFLTSVRESGADGRCTLTRNGLSWGVSLKSSASDQTVGCDVACIN